MSVAAARWVADFLKRQEPPHKGGPSRALRAVLTALARDANALTHIAFTSAPKIAVEFGYYERHVRRMFDQLESHGFHRVKRPGRSDAWHLDPSKMSTTPVIWCPGSKPATPVISHRDPGHFAPRPRSSDDRGRDEGFVEERALRLAAEAPPPGDRRRVAEIIATAAKYSMRPSMFGSHYLEVLSENPPIESNDRSYAVGGADDRE